MSRGTGRMKLAHPGRLLLRGAGAVVTRSQANARGGVGLAGTGRVAFGRTTIPGPPAM